MVQLKAQTLEKSETADIPSNHPGCAPGSTEEFRELEKASLPIALNTTMLSLTRALPVEPSSAESQILLLSELMVQRFRTEGVTEIRRIQQDTRRDPTSRSVYIKKRIEDTPQREQELLSIEKRDYQTYLRPAMIRIPAGPQARIGNRRQHGKA